MHRFAMVNASMMGCFTLPVLCLSFLLAWQGCSSKPISSQSVVIRAGGQSITVGDMERIVKITSFENGITQKVVWSSIKSVVDRIVTDSLILEYGRDKGITLHEIELERAIQNIVKDYPGNSFKETLLTRCIDYTEWKERLKEQLLIQKIVKKQTESLDPIPYQAIRSYYQERREEFSHPPRAQFMHIIVKTKKEAETVLARLKGGEDMTKLVEEQSVYHGFQGDCGTQWHTRDTLPPSLSDKVFSIPVGKMSGSIKTEYGFHIVKVLKREPRGRKDLLEVMAEIETELLGKALEEHYAAWVNELMEKYPVKVNYSLLERMSTTDASD